MSLSKLHLKNRLRVAGAAFVATLVLGSLTAFSQDSVRLAENAPDKYVVQVGDTLWDISATFLKDPWYWPEIWYVNPQVENPHLIYPGDVLALTYVEGAPRVSNLQGSSYRLSPEARVSPLTEAIKSVSHEKIAAFLSRGVIVEKSEVGALPYLVATRGEHLIAAAGNTVYIRGNTGAVGTRYNIVHIGDKLVDPDDNRLVGYQGIEVGSGTLRRTGDPARPTHSDICRNSSKFLPESTKRQHKRPDHGGRRWCTADRAIPGRRDEPRYI